MGNFCTGHLYHWFVFFVSSLFNFEWINDVKFFFFFKYLNISLLLDLIFTAPWGAAAPSLRSTDLDDRQIPK
jgi:hypothetical protein